MKNKSGIEAGRPWAVKTFSGYAGGSTREAKVNLIIEGQADEVEDVRAMVDKAVNAHADLFQERDRLREVNADLLAACERALPWIGKLLAEELHNRCASPADAENTAELLRAAILKAKGQT